MSKKLYVGNLTYNVNESDLEALFTPFGTVQSAQVIVDRDTNRSKGFGFVEMDTDAEAQAAIQGLNARDHDGRNLTVNEAKPREARSGGGGGGMEAAAEAAAVAATAVAVAAAVAIVIDRPPESRPFEGLASPSPSTHIGAARPSACTVAICRGRRLIGCRGLASSVIPARPEASSRTPSGPGRLRIRQPDSPGQRATRAGRADPSGGLF